MRFPRALLQRGRPTLPKQRIHLSNYMYSRHKPSSDWDYVHGLPDFTRIRHDQSYNWCLFSIPAWTRFNSQHEYLQDYAVAAFSVRTIRESQPNGSISGSIVLDIEHRPQTDNYSHCELVTPSELTKIQKRQIRMKLRHNCHVPLYPDQHRNRLGMFLDVLSMHMDRIRHHPFHART